MTMSFETFARRSGRTALALAAATLAIATMGCEAYDLGDNPPPEISVDSANPEWEFGVRQVIEEKCDNCHSRVATRFTPENARIHNYGLAESEARFVATYARSARHRMFDTPNDPMPPNFGTALTSNEKAALQKYFERVIPATDTSADCATTTTLRFADVAGIIDQSCAGAACHAGPTKAGIDAQFLKPLRNVAEYKVTMENPADALSALGRVKSGNMPKYGGAAFKASADGAKLIEWMCASPELR